MRMTEASNAAGAAGNSVERDSCAFEGLVSALSPVRSLIHSLLADGDAARLMRVNAAFTAALLAGYPFRRQLQPNEPTALALGRMSALYERYGLRVTRLALQREFVEEWVDGGTGRSLLPSGLVELQVGRDVTESARDGSDRVDVDLSAVVDEDDAARDDVEQRVALYCQRMRAAAVKAAHVSEGWWNQPIPPGALPSTLQRLQLGSSYDQPLCPGALPLSLTSLELGLSFKQPLGLGHLPSSLTRLTLSYRFNQLLLPGVLPASLRELWLGATFNQPLLPGSLPAGLRRLTTGGNFDQPLAPGILPASLTHLHFGARFDQELLVGALPAGLVQLYLSICYRHSLLVGALPSSLRELQFLCRDRSCHFDQPLLPGQLPDGLQCLALPEHFRHYGSMAALPSGLLVLDMGRRYFTSYPGEARELKLTVELPSRLRWLRMPEGGGSMKRQRQPAGVQWLQRPGDAGSEEVNDVNQRGSRGMSKTSAILLASGR